MTRPPRVPTALVVDLVGGGVVDDRVTTAAARNAPPRLSPPDDIRVGARAYAPSQALTRSRPLDGGGDINKN